MYRSIITFVICFIFQAICAQSVVEKDFVVQNGEISLPGTLTLVNDINTPVIVLVHGSGPNDRNETVGQNKMFEQLAKGLAAEGVSTLRYDKRTLLYKTGVEDMTYREETVDDAVQAIRQLKAEGYKHIFVAGHSLGGHLAPLIAADAKDNLDGVILLSGNTTTLKSALDAQLHYIGKMQGATEEQIMASLNQMLASLPEKYREYDEQYDCIKALRSVMKDAPALRWMVVQGGHDYQVTISDFYVWQMAFGTKATYYYGETLDHILRPLPQMATPADYMQPGNIDQEVTKAIAKFCKEFQ